VDWCGRGGRGRSFSPYRLRRYGHTVVMSTWL
jgi:hypothetical protein